MKEINADILLGKIDCEGKREIGWSLKHEMARRGSREGEAVDGGERGPPDGQRSHIRVDMVGI